MHTQTLKIFCDIVELNSFAKAGEKNLLTQSAVSQQLAQLDSAYKCQLLGRKTKPFRLTAAGELFYNAAKDILERLEKYDDALDSLRKAASNRINVAAIYSIGMHSLPPYIKAFMADYPDVNVHVEYLSSREIYELVLRDGIDIGLVAVPSENRHIQIHHFADEPLVVVCSPEHPLAKKSKIPIRQLRGQKFIAFEEGIPTRTLIDGILGRYNVEVRKMMEFDNIETIKQAVEIGAGISILPEPTVRKEAESGSLTAIRLIAPVLQRPLGIIHRQRKVFTPTAAKFIELLSEIEGGAKAAVD